MSLSPNLFLGVASLMSNEDLCERSGNVKIRSRLTSFLYGLMRDHLTPGTVEELVQESVAVEVTYTNGYLAQYAFDVAKQLQPDMFPQGGVYKDVLRNFFMLVKEGAMTPTEASEKIYASLTSDVPILTTNKNETMDPLPPAPNPQ